jgi:UDP-GlcNAc:undecaprenyl-phosphate GlcNAc-1-phosphate transferase
VTFPAWWIFVLALATFAVALVLTPLVRGWALRAGFFDHPGTRKVHLVAMPTGGGFAVAIAFLAGLWASTLLPGAPGQDVVIGLTAVGVIALVLGWLDDRFGVPAALKLLVQAGCGFLLHSLGFGIDKLSNPLGGAPIQLQGIGVVVDVIWVLAITNAINLSDGLDGLAAGVVAISTTALIAVAANHQDGAVVWVGALLVGATLGFLRSNFPPAKIFLGDTGSQFLGMMMAALALIENNKGPAAVSLLLPIVAMGLPLVDSTLAFLRRRGRIFRADQEHLHHRLIHLGLTQRQAVSLLYFGCAYLGIAAYALSLLPRNAVLLVLILLAMGLWLALETLRFIDRRTPRDR